MSEPVMKPPPVSTDTHAPKIPPAVSETMRKAAGATAQAVGVGMQKTGKPIMGSLRALGQQVESLRPGQVGAVLLNLCASPVLVIYYWMVIASGLRTFGSQLSVIISEEYEVDLANVIAMGILAFSWISYKTLFTFWLSRQQATSEQVFVRVVALMFVVGDFALSVIGFMEDSWGMEGFSLPGALLISMLITGMIVMLSYWTAKLCQKKEV